jgi:glucose/arabinose dehydrogenase
LAEQIVGLGGNDTLLAGSGADTVSGGSGDDSISGGEARDSSLGGSGADVNYGFGPTEILAGSARITLTNVGTQAFTRPVFASSAPGEPDRLYVVEQHTGRILVLDTLSGESNVTPFLDLDDASLAGGTGQGLLGMAFHPDYVSNGQFFVFVTRADGDIEVRSYQRSASDPAVADASSGNVVLTIDQDAGANGHNAGWIGFGPDGMLYVAVGDESSGDDPANNAQNVDVLWGKMLRIDVDGDDFVGDETRDYAIPDDNPFVGRIGADEIWALGLRNPWRNSFDRLTGDLYVADVGQSSREEINVQLAGAPGGANYGWKVREGNLVYDDSVPGNPPADSPLLTPPAVTYGHDASGGFAVVGGYVYRGETTAMQGRYFYADHVTNQLWSFRLVEGAAVDVTNHTQQLVSRGGSLAEITSFAEDGRGNLYVIGIGGIISKLGFDAGLTDSHDILSGGDGDDRLYGGACQGTLDGDVGSDTVEGGGGTDLLGGGLHADTFVLVDTTDSECGTGKDRIGVFESQINKIGQRQAFSFIDSDGFRSGDGFGEVRFTRGLLQGDIDDGGPDFAVVFEGATSLLPSDILL